MSHALATLTELHQQGTHIIAAGQAGLQQTVHAASDLVAAKDPKPSPTGGSGAGSGVKNPFTNILPDFSILGDTFNTTWKRVFAASWAIGLIIAGWTFIPALITYIKTKGGHHPQAQSEALSDLKKSSIGLGGLICLVPIFAIIFAVLG